MININGFPLLHEDECKEFFSPDCVLSSEFLIRPMYKSLPDFSDMNEKEKMEYGLRSLKEGLYLVGLEVISSRCVNKGFCGMLLNKFGLVLSDAYPAEIKSERTLVYLNFKHISEAVHRMEVSLDS